MDIDGARAYLKTVMSDRFTDRTFEHYIDHTLAGDFAVEIATSIKGLEEEVDALTAENTRIFTMVDAREQTIAELTALCDEYRGERDILKDEVAVKCKDCNRNDAFAENVELRAALTRARAEGMEDAAKVLDSVGWNGVGASPSLLIRERATVVRAAKGEQ